MHIKCRKTTPVYIGFKMSCLNYSAWLQIGQLSCFVWLRTQLHSHQRHCMCSPCVILETPIFIHIFYIEQDKILEFLFTIGRSPWHPTLQLFCHSTNNAPNILSYNQKISLIDTDTNSTLSSCLPETGPLPSHYCNHFTPLFSNGTKNSPIAWHLPFQGTLLPFPQPIMTHWSSAGGPTSI